MTLLRLLFHNPSNRCISEAAAAGLLSEAPARACVVQSEQAWAADGEKCAPHWRHIVLLAAAYSCCLKPQCGHSTLTLTGDDFATVSLRKANLCPCPERCRLYRLLVTNYVRTCLDGLAAWELPPSAVPLVTSDFPMNVAPSSITRRAAFKSPCKVQRDFSSQRSPTVILP